VEGPHSYPGTYMAGGYDRQVSKIKGKEVSNEVKIRNLKDPDCITDSIGDSLVIL
jgi:hypothetical protein